MAAPLKIYGIPQSRALRCLWMARELAIPHENVHVHFAKARESEDLVKANPNARIPAIDDNGFTLYESMAINLYLARKYGAGKPVAPATPEEEALATQWSFWVMTEIEKPLLTIMLHAVGMRPVASDVLAQCEADLQRPLKVLEDHLATRDWLIADRFTVADLNVAAVMIWAKTGKLDLTAWPRTADWLRRCMARPAFKG
ncbi:MAG: glutathione S-transferase family protein [Acetobacteraceae bacterium]